VFAKHGLTFRSGSAPTPARWLVTGARRGIGRAVALGLADAGAGVILLAQPDGIMVIRVPAPALSRLHPATVNMR
jgi:NAD(P)-dependent dehydrogenase (short-subunit alcohol dehydrogenase family)